MQNNEMMIMNGTQEVTLENGERMIMELTGEKKIQYCSMVPKNKQEKIALFNAMNNPDERLSDKINMVINLKNVFVESVQLVSEVTGEIQYCPRVVLIDDKGVGYQCVSQGVFSCLKKLFNVFGDPTTWEAPLKVEVKQIKKGEKSLLTLNVK